MSQSDKHRDVESSMRLARLAEEAGRTMGRSDRHLGLESAKRLAQLTAEVG
ncbi:hypothetical protein [Corallococcus sp. 4LFB]|uniref:hypothetical protein n=1 Tax=Corallococcus sp. 4LFB TaxID=3383249 RepID=UPI003975DD69